MSDLLTDIDLAPETLKEPPKVWFNWWRARCAVNDHRIGSGLGCVRREAGEVYASWRSWPSHDLAETDARRLLGYLDTAKCCEYLGAFPEGERP
jgi:hypothetical protein